ncbi:MAG: carboxypeptidase-like regulatory domain-containing protein [Alistipes sp.]|nr:carboxypeptidase-like regulatory domain-containing protein [Alistipes sp.]
MKNLLKFAFSIALLAVLFCSFDVAAAPVAAADTSVTVSDSEVVIRGVVKDRQNRRRLSRVNVTLDGTNIGTVSNADGAFELRFSPADFRRVKFSHIGYATSYLYPAEAGDALTVWMNPAETVLSDVVVYGADPRHIVDEAIAKVDRNYPAHGTMSTWFYRETVQKGRRYIGVSEAVMELFKTAYAGRSVIGDRVRMLKGRQLVSQRSRDTLSVKVAGGPNLALEVDIAKNPDALLDPVYLNDYRFEMAGTAELDGRMQYVIAFRPQRRTTYPVFAGTLYIDRERLAITRAEFEMDLTDKELAVRSVLRKKPSGLRFNPLKIAFVIGYRLDGDKSYLNYVQNAIRAKCDWRKRLFTSVYSTYTEMVAVDRDDAPIAPINRKEAFRSGQIFSDLVDDYGDANYWAGYNVIPPTESLEHAVERLKKESRP